MRVARLSPEQHTAARSTLGRAFFDYPLMCYAAPDDARRLRATTSLYRAILSDCLRHGEVVAADEAAAVACWLRPGVRVANLWRQVRAGMLAVPLRFGVGGVRILLSYDALALRLHHEHAPEPHWYLAALGVAPERQGQGLGGRLLEPQLARADREGVACYLDTHRDTNVQFYERHGFRVMWHGSPPGHAVTIWSMRREPR